MTDPAGPAIFACCAVSGYREDRSACSVSREKGSGGGEYNPEALERIYQRWPLEKLVRVLTFESNRHSTEAISVMRRVLESHSISKDEFDEALTTALSEQQAPVERLNRIRGIVSERM